jgi:hypothetical protein
MGDHLAQMLLPHMWLRKLWLRHTLRRYPLYDPPNKVEERLLSPEKARENFDYFMQVREQRVAFFYEWLHRHFWITLTPDSDGVRALNRWGNRYAGLLLERNPRGNLTHTYFTYDPAWTGDNAGCNALFDMGITLGESLIACCPKLRWDFEPTATVLPRSAKKLQRSPGMSFQRPELTGSDNPTWTWSPLHSVFTFANQMSREITTFKGRGRFLARSKESRRRFREQLSNSFESMLSYYPAFDPHGLQQKLPKADYLDLIDVKAEQEDDHRGR